MSLSHLIILLEEVTMRLRAAQKEGVSERKTNKDRVMLALKTLYENNEKRRAKAEGGLSKSFKSLFKR